MLPPFYGQSYEPGLWSGSVWDDLADYTAWVTECAVWEAMMTRQGQGQGQPGGGDRPA